MYIYKIITFYIDMQKANKIVWYLYHINLTFMKSRKKMTIKKPYVTVSVSTVLFLVLPTIIFLR